jgi:tetratricopeptide (TPR) repeat protein
LKALTFASSFKRAYKATVRRRPDLSPKILGKLRLLSTDPFDVSIQGRQNLPNLPPTFPSVGWSVALLLVGGMIGWQLALRHTRKTSSYSATASDAANNNQSQNPAQLDFSQALQWVAYAKTLQKSKQYEEAVAIYDQGLVHHPNDFRLWHERGLALALLERFEEAIASYDCAYKIKPHQQDLAHERGDALLMLERYEEAVASFNVYLEYYPKTFHVIADKGYALFKLNRFEEALPLLNSVLNSKEEPDLKAYAHYYQIASLQELEALGEALKSSQTAMRLYPQKYIKTQNETLKQKIFEA